MTFPFLTEAASTGSLVFLSGVAYVIIAVLLYLLSINGRTLRSVLLLPGVAMIGIEKIIISLDCIADLGIPQAILILLRLYIIFSFYEFIRVNLRTDKGTPLFVKETHFLLAISLFIAYFFVSLPFDSIVFALSNIAKIAACYVGIKYIDREPEEIRSNTFAAFVVSAFLSLLQIPTQVFLFDNMPHAYSTYYRIIGVLHLVELIIISSIILLRLSYSPTVQIAKKQNMAKISIISPMLVAFLSACVMLISLGSTIYLANNSKISANKHLYQKADKLAKEIEKNISQADFFSLLLSSLPQVEEYILCPLPEKFNLLKQELLSFDESFPDILLYVTDLTGKVIVSSHINSLMENKNISSREYFLEAIRGKTGKQIGDGFFTKESGYYSSRPIYNTDNKEITGIAIAKKHINKREELTEPYKPAAIIKTNGTILASSNLPPEASNLSGIRNFTTQVTDLSKVLHEERKDAAKIRFAARAVSDTDWLAVVFGKYEPIYIATLPIAIGFSISVVLFMLLWGIISNSESVQAIASAKQNFKTVFDNTPESILLVEPENLKILNANKHAKKAFCNRNLPSLTLTDLLYERSQALSFQDFAKVSLEEPAPQVEMKFLASSNGEHIFEGDVATSMIEIDEKPVLLVIIRDITASKQIAKNLQESEEMRSRLLANAGHEIRTPVTAIIGLSELIVSSNKNPEQNKILELLRTACQSLRSLLEDVFVLVQSDRGHIRLKREVFNLPKLIEDINKLSKFQARLSSVKIAFKVCEKLPEFAVSDPDRLRQVVLNILTATTAVVNKREITIAVCALPHPEQKQNKAVLSISLENEKKETIEEILNSLSGRTLYSDPYKIDESNSRMGLSVALKIIERMEGKFETLLNDDEKTSSLQLLIPIDIPNELIAKSASKRKQINAFTGQQLKVLIADDNEINLFLAQSIMKKIGAATKTVNNGKEAVDALKAERFDLLLIDMQMPVMDGFAAIKAVRDYEKENGKPEGEKVKIIAISAFSLEEDHERAITAGAQSYICKPYFPEDLIEEISKVLDSEVYAPISDSLILNTKEELAKKLLENITPAKIEPEEAGNVTLEELESAADLQQIDLKSLNRRITKSVKDLLSIADIFEKRAEELDIALDKAISEDDTKALQETMHSLKGLSGMISADRVFNLMLKMEKLANEEKTEDFIKLVPELRRKMFEIQEDFDTLRHMIVRN
ncbi:MAG: response regulator [Candidatus Riflebacteria bacterium]|nr:response regulator [Candidatus Riflebacteria bacterium]